jgi:RES domain-containing protein
MRLWRIGNRFHPVWSSDGARLKGGRWNQRGSPAAYTAESFALAVLEVLVHAGIGRVPVTARYVTADVPDDVPVDRVVAEELPGWDLQPPGGSVHFGERWLRERKGLVLLVPSVVTRGLDSNALLNPMHPDFGRIVVSEEQPVQWDGRLFESA